MYKYTGVTETDAEVIQCVMDLLVTNVKLIPIVTVTAKLTWLGFVRENDYTC